MKTLYWSFLLMLLPSMAYTQNTEKENYCCPMKLFKLK